MIPCCPIPYEKYLEKDGAFNRVSFYTILHNLRIKGISINLPEEKLCKCICHQIGINILH